LKLVACSFDQRVLKPSGNCLPASQGLASIEGPLIPGPTYAFYFGKREQGY